MICYRCKKELEEERAAKMRILREIFGEPWNPDWDECYECHERLSRRVKRFFSDLVDPIWWEYHSWYDFQRVVLRRKSEEFTLPLWWR